MPWPPPGGLPKRRNPLWFVMSMVLVVTLSGCPVAQVQAQGQALWRGSEYGMTAGQVRQRFPGVVVPDSPDVLYSGAEELLRIPALELAGHRFQASFFFDDGRLVQVMLSLVDGDSGAGSQAFDALSRALGEEHGSELTSERRGAVRSRSTWRSGTTQIVLLLSTFGEADALLNLVYQALPADR